MQGLMLWGANWLWQPNCGQLYVTFGLLLSKKILATWLQDWVKTHTVCSQGSISGAANPFHVILMDARIDVIGCKLVMAAQLWPTMSLLGYAL
jgi:hypothetical protein